MRNYVLSCGGVLALLLTTSVASAQPGGKHPLDAGFAKWDTNKDGFLDSGELAKAFRGPNAKVIQDKAGVREAHPDHQFLDAWDANKDGKISTAEFEKYEQQQLAAAKAARNRTVNYSRVARPGYRAPHRHSGGVRGMAGTNPYLNQLRYQQRAYQQQRAAYANLLRYGVYSPNVRGGYRGAMTHNHNVRRR